MYIHRSIPWLLLAAVGIAAAVLADHTVGMVINGAFAGFWVRDLLE